MDSLARRNGIQSVFEEIASNAEHESGERLYPISLEEYCKRLGINRLNNAARALKKNYIIDVDYIKAEYGGGDVMMGRPIKNYWMTLYCAKKLLGRASLKQMDTSGHIYVIRHGGADIFKVGKSIDTKQRMSRLQVGNPIELILMSSFIFSDMSKTERRLHAKLEEFRIRGEWFECSYDIIVAGINEELKFE